MILDWLLSGGASQVEEAGQERLESALCSSSGLFCLAGNWYSVFWAWCEHKTYISLWHCNDSKLSS